MCGHAGVGGGMSRWEVIVMPGDILGSVRLGFPRGCACCWPSELAVRAVDALHGLGLPRLKVQPF
jgi:hypothetical protein